MISDEPDEDADSLDDESLMETALGSASEPRDATGRRSGSAIIQDWPLSRLQGLELDIDVQTLAWFKANHVNWRRAMGSVLRGWIAAKSRANPDGPRRE